MKDGYCENCWNPAECYMTGRCWPSDASTNQDKKIKHALASKGQRKAAESADEKPGGQAENEKGMARGAPESPLK